MKIGPHEVGGENPAFITAEIGINHNGDLENVCGLINAAVEAGCHAVKFQKRTVDLVYTREELAQPRESPFGHTNGDLKRGLEFGLDDYWYIDKYCKQKGILWYASPWDIPSVSFLAEFNPPCYKVASALITDLALIQEIVGQQKPIIMSTGMSTLEEVDRAIRDIGDVVPLALLACVSTYPTPVENLNLRRISYLRKFYPFLLIGYSGHEVGVYTTLCAVAMGAKLVERHITLDRSMFGSDQAASLEPKALAKLVEEIETYELALGSGEIRCLPEEEAIKKKLRRT
jgi:N-acetylneuraminate synthase